MFQESELVCLALAIPLCVPVFLLARSTKAPLRFLLASAAFALGAAVFTVAEHVVLGEVFNLLEHLGYALAGLLAAAGCWRLARWSRKAEGDSP